jgi:hypothetical protein
VPTTSDPRIVNKLAEELTAGTQENFQVATEAPADTLVKLPAGLINKDRTVSKVAEIRELNGLDEEAIAKSGNTSKALLTILQRGLLTIGERQPVKEDFDAMLSGDRDSILLGIRKATFGRTVEYTGYCVTCDGPKEFTIDLDKDIEVKELDNPLERTWTLPIKAGRAVISLPNGITQRKVMDNQDKTLAELNTIILAGCVLSINESPTTPNTVLELGIQDRETLIREIIDRNPGPRLGEVTKACEACGTDVELPLSLASLFRL